MKLSTQDILEVEKYLKDSNDIIYVFTPNNVGDWNYSEHSRQFYLDWLHKQYPGKVFKYTNTLLSNSIHCKLSYYLKVQWQFRDTSLGILRNNLINLRNEIVPLRKIKQTLVCLKQAQLEMDKLKI